MAISSQALAEGWTEHNLNGDRFYFHAASGIAQQTLPLGSENTVFVASEVRGLCSNAADERARAAAAGRGTMEDWRRQHAGQEAREPPVAIAQTENQPPAALQPASSAPQYFAQPENQPPVAIQCGSSSCPGLAQPQPQPPFMQTPCLMPQAFQTQALRTLPQQFTATAPSYPGQQSLLADSAVAVIGSVAPLQQQPPVESVQERDQTRCWKAAVRVCCLSGIIFVVAGIILLKTGRHFHHFHGFGPHHHMHRVLPPWMLLMSLLVAVALCLASALLVSCKKGSRHAQIGQNDLRPHSPKKYLGVAILAFTGLGILIGAIVAVHHHHHHGFWSQHHGRHGMNAQQQHIPYAQGSWQATHYSDMPALSKEAGGMKNQYTDDDEADENLHETAEKKAGGVRQAEKYEDEAYGTAHGVNDKRNAMIRGWQREGMPSMIADRARHFLM